MRERNTRTHLFVTLLAALSVNAYANEPSLGSRTPFHYVYQELVPQEHEQLLVSDPVYKDHFLANKSEIDFEQKFGRSVFWATTGTGTGSGTGFLVGKNLVLTNRHVLANIDKKCNKFDIKGVLNGNRFQTTCKEVIFCGVAEENDFCLIRMNPMSDGRELGDVFGTLKLSPTLADYHDHLTILGNTEHLFNLVAAGGTYTIQNGPTMLHFTPARSGNSGSPLVADNGQVYGIHFGRDGDFDSRGNLYLINAFIPKSVIPADFSAAYCIANQLVGRAVSSVEILKELQANAPKIMRELSIGEPIAPKTVVNARPLKTNRIAAHEEI